MLCCRVSKQNIYSSLLVLHSPIRTHTHTHTHTHVQKYVYICIQTHKHAHRSISPVFECIEWPANVLNDQRTVACLQSSWFSGVPVPALSSSEQRCSFQCSSFLVPYVFLQISNASSYSSADMSLTLEVIGTVWWSVKDNLWAAEGSLLYISTGRGCRVE